MSEEYQEGNIDLTFIYDSIVDTNAVIEDGFPANVMPQNFGEVFTEEELQQLVAFIATQDCQE